MARARFDTLDAALTVIDLGTRRILAINEAGARLAGRAGAEIIGHAVEEFFEPAIAARIGQALDAVATGAIDFYYGGEEVGVRLPAGGHVPIRAWGRRLLLSDRPGVLVELAPAGRQPGRFLPMPVAGGAPTIAVGTLDRLWHVTCVSREAGALLGADADALIGASFASVLDRRDRPKLQEVARRLPPGSSATVAVEVAAGQGGPRLRLMLSRLASGQGWCFLLLEADPHLDEAARVATLEGHLWRIAAEVDASGILSRVTAAPRLTQAPELRGLSARQWEVLHRLVAGERVPEISSDLFLSQSTVRNHLSAVFRRFGVRSQAELLTLLSERGLTA